MKLIGSFQEDREAKRPMGTKRVKESTKAKEIFQTENVTQFFSQ